MSMAHKAYSLDHDLFVADLAPILRSALASGDQDALAAFIDRNLRMLALPWDPSPLPREWRTLLERGDVDELGDIALTKYYDPSQDRGLQERWLELDQTLPEQARPCLLGEAFGPPDNPFDPGRMGSYFQDPASVVRSRDILAGSTGPMLEPFRTLLQETVEAGRGLYVTF